MLVELDIGAYKLLRQTLVRFGPGLTALTGETGVGKSMLFGALHFLLGAKAGEEVFAADVQEVRVTGVFELDSDRPEVQALIAAGFWDPAEDPEFVIERLQQRGGRGRLFLNGRRLTLAAAGQIEDALIDELGQNQARYLTSIDPLELLDRYADAKHLALLEAMRAAHGAWRSAVKQLEATAGQLAELAARRDFLAFQKQELDQAALEDDEEARLEAELGRQGNVQELTTLALEAAALLNGGERDEPSADDRLSEAMDRLDRLATLDPEWMASRADLQELLERTRDLGASLARYGESLEADPVALARVERRIQQIEGLKRKYRTSFEGLRTLHSQVTAQLAQVEEGDTNLEALEKAVGATRAEALKLAQQLSTARGALAKQVARAVASELHDLQLTGAKVEFTLSPDPDKLKPAGIDRAELLLSTNPREPLQPFQQIASGGEVTRLALAFKALQSAYRARSILIIDEGDLGIGGDTAFSLGKRFKALAAHQQVIVVSHLPQVAAQADRQLAVSKDKKGAIAITEVEGTERIAELARMLGASADPDRARELAASFIAAR